MFKRTEEQEWTRFSKALSGPEKEEVAADAEETPPPAAAEPGPPQAAATPTPATPRQGASDVNVSVSRVAPPAPRPNSGNGEIETIIGPQSSFNGTLRSEASVRLIGSVDGEVYSKDTVVVEEQARVKAKITAATITVAGQVSGELHCGGRVEILPTGRVHGEIQAATLVMQEGAFFEGHLKMGEAAAEEPAREAAEAPSAAAAARNRR